ncbi:uncharacterized protein [Malus domestica]
MLDEELKEAAACDEVKAALSVKISRERIGTEIDLMISGNQPVQAMAYISDWKLFWVVFSLHMKHEPEVLEGCDRLCVSYLEATWNLIQLIGQSTFTVSDKDPKFNNILAFLQYNLQWINKEGFLCMLLCSFQLGRPCIKITEEKRFHGELHFPGLP